MTPAETEAAWEATCGDVRAAIGMSIDMKLAPVKGKPMAQVKQEFYTELAREVYAAGCRRGFAEAKARFEP